MPFIQNYKAVSRHWWLVIPLGILALMLAHWMALVFRNQPGISLWFPPSGVAIALTFWFGYIGAIMTAIASIIMAPLWGHDGWSRLIGLVDIIEPLTAWFLYQRFCRGSLLLNRLKDAAAFILSAPLAACVTSALVGSLILLASGEIKSADLVTSISQWWLGNALGTIAIAPIALLLITPLLINLGWLKHSDREDAPIDQFSNFERKDWLEVVAIAFFSISTAAITVSETNNAGFAFQQLSFLSFVPMIWAAVRFGVSGAMITASFCVFSTLCAYLIKYPHALSLNAFPVSIEVLYVHKLSLLIQCGVTLLMGTAITEKTAVQVALAVEQVRTKEHQVRGQLTDQLTELNTSLGKTNTALEETLAMLDALLDSAPMGISYRDRNLRCIRTNTSMAEMIGVYPQESIGKKVSEVSPRLGQILEPLMQSILDTGKPVLNFEINNEAIAPIGQVRYWLCNYYPVHINGEIIGIGGSIAEITELKHIETALRSSESRLRQIINSGMVGITFGDFSGNILECNQAFLNMFGYTQEDVLQQNLRWDSLTPAEYFDLDAQVIAELRSTGVCTPYEKEFLRKDGSRVPVLIAASLLEDSQYQAVGLILDITQRKKAEKTLQYLAETSNILATYIDYEATLVQVARLPIPQIADWCSVEILQADNSIRRICVTHADPSKAEWALKLQQYPPDYNSEDLIVRVLKTGEPVIISEVPDALLEVVAHNAEHLQILRELKIKSGMVVPLIARDRILGTLTLATAESDRYYSSSDLPIAEDLARRAALAIDNARLYQEATQARENAEQAANRTARLQAVTAALSESLTPPQVADVLMEQGVAVLGANSGLVALLDETGTELEIVSYLGYEQAQIEGWRKFSINAPVPLAEAIRDRKPIWEEPTEERIARYPHLAKNYASYSYSAWISIPFIAEGQVLGGVSFSFAKAHQLSEDDRSFMLALTQQCAQAIARARLYEAEQAARSIAETANRIKDEFLTVLSHELRSPLNPILGWTKLLRTRKYDQAATDRALEIIERNAKLQTQLIDDLLDVSRILRGKLSLNTAPVSLQSVIEAAMETMRLAAEAKSIEMQFYDHSSLAIIAGDPNRLQQVVWNLISNAIKFTDTGGKIEIYLSNDDGLADYSLTNNLPPKYAEIKVIDTGKGIKPEFLPYVFEHFRQADASITRKYGGLGLGLAIVRHLVEMHGGTVKADSKGEGQGAIFTVRLPLLNIPELKVISPESDLPPTSDSLPLKGLRVLVVDDEPDSREFVSFVIEQAGAEIKEVASAGEALAVITQYQPDILVSDIGMPEEDGYSLIRKVRSLEPVKDIPAIAVTAYAREEDSQEAISAGFQIHISKPVEPEELVNAIVSLTI